MKKIIFATGNSGKMREIRDILADVDAEVYSLKDLGIISRAEESGGTFGENAYIKVREIYDILIKAASEKACGYSTDEDSPVLRLLSDGSLSDIVIMADDSGLAIDCFEGAPGVRSARFMGYDTSYDIKNAAILKKMEGVPAEKRGAAFVCHICALTGDGKRYDAEEEMRGTIGYEIRGSEGFGYDPIFYLPEYGCTSAEITEEEKNAISHRGKGLRRMRQLLKADGVLYGSRPQAGDDLM